VAPGDLEGDAGREDCFTNYGPLLWVDDHRTVAGRGCMRLYPHAGNPTLSSCSAVDYSILLNGISPLSSSSSLLSPPSLLHTAVRSRNTPSNLIVDTPGNHRSPISSEESTSIDLNSPVRCRTQLPRLSHHPQTTTRESHAANASHHAHIGALISNSHLRFHRSSPSAHDHPRIRQQWPRSRRLCRCAPSANDTTPLTPADPNSGSGSSTAWRRAA
jgi:hypothetical protein